MSKAQNIIIVELILAALFVGCLAPLPYGYFILVRFSATVGFLLLAWGYSQRKEQVQMIAALVLAAPVPALCSTELRARPVEYRGRGRRHCAGL